MKNNYFVISLCISIFLILNLFFIKPPSPKSKENETFLIRNGTSCPYVPYADWATGSLLHEIEHRYKVAKRKIDTSYADREIGKGKGIVMVGIGKHFGMMNASLTYLYKVLKSSVKTEIWYYEDEFPIDLLTKLAEVDMKISFHVFPETHKNLLFLAPSRKFGEKPFHLKIYALLLSSFQDALFLDTDNLPLRDPDFLFSSIEYKTNV